MRLHEHQAVASSVGPYRSPVTHDRRRREPLARNCATLTQFCVCGAEKRSNCNGGYEERGDWEVPRMKGW